MLVIIGDLHLSDGTAGRHNVPATAFAGWYNEVLSLALQYGAKEICLLYLGDIVDLLRSERWFDRPGEASDAFCVEHRPWGDPDINDHPDRLQPECLARAREILDAVEVECNDQLALLGGELDRLGEAFQSEHAVRLDRIREKLSRLNIPIHRLYLPGNHDRLYRLDEEIRRRIDSRLGVQPDRPVRLGLFANVYQNPRYGVIARHGQEWDRWNFEDFQPDREADRIPDEAFLKTPIGDPITTELAVRLPLELKRRLEEDGAFSDLEVGQIYQRMQSLDNVRPLAATIPWILMQGRIAAQPTDARRPTANFRRASRRDDQRRLPPIHGNSIRPTLDHPT